MKRILLIVITIPIVGGWTGYFTKSGKPVKWERKQIVFMVDSKGTKDIEGDEEFWVIEKSMETWNDVPCPHPKFIYGGKIEGESPGEDNENNLIIFQDADGWEHPEFMNAIALTTLYYTVDSGVMKKVDIEYADFLYTFTTTDDPSLVKTDLQNTTTHELGHALCLNDNTSKKDKETTMYWKAESGDLDKRTLHEDDIDGLCTLYAFMKDPNWEQTESSGTGGGNNGCQAGKHGGIMILILLVFLIWIYRVRVRRFITLFIFLIVLSPLMLTAKEIFDLDLKTKVLVGKDKPKVVMVARESAKNVVVSLSRSDGNQNHVYKIGNMKSGERKEFVIEQGVGRFEWRLEISYQGSEEPEVFVFEVVVAKPIEIKISKETVDLVQGNITFSASEAISKVNIKILGEEGRLILDMEKDIDANPGELVNISFKPPNETITLVQLRVFDIYGFYNGVDITPFFVEIPHEEVQFEFGKADILPGEESKLVKTFEEVKKALAKFGNEMKPRLYIAGYTDRVGSREYNLDLSERRAMAIARWFINHGFHLKVCYQGFGEDVLAVETEDEIPEPRNRRTIHVLGTQPPPISRVFPRSDWKCL